MRNRGVLILVATLALFGWGMLELFEARFESGDWYPIGSSYRSDALGTRAIHDAIAEALPKTVTRHRGRSGQLGVASDATILVTHLSFSRLVAKADPLISELTQAARLGARVVVSLDDRESMTCQLTYCNEVTKTRCQRLNPLEERRDGIPQPVTSVQPAADSMPGANPPVTSVQPAADSTPGANQPVTVVSRQSADANSCIDAALGIWGFEIGGSKASTNLAVERSDVASPSLPVRLPWHSPAKFIELSSEFRTIYVRYGTDAVVVERPLGKGCLVLMSEGYLLSNEAQRNEPFTEFVVWLIGPNRRVIFEESHLGVTEPLGVMTLARELRLQGFFAGCVLLFGLFTWQRLRPLSQRSRVSLTRAGNQDAGESTLHLLLRRSMTPKQAMLACVEEAKQERLLRVVERAVSINFNPSVEGFNRVFCSEQERPASR